MVLRRLEERAALPPDAAAYAVVRGSAINQGGRSSGLTAPNGPAQTALVRAALASGGLLPAQLECVSVHGTGTPLGDPIEVGALSQALPASSRGGGSSSGAAVTLISNKACFGHTEGTAGLTGLLLAAASLQQATAPPVMHLRSLNPYVAAALTDWVRQRGAAVRAPRQAAPAAGTGLLAGSSSFGMSGVNAHMLVGDAPDRAAVGQQVRHLVPQRVCLRVCVQPAGSQARLRHSHAVLGAPAGALGVAAAAAPRGPARTRAAAERQGWRGRRGGLCLPGRQPAAGIPVGLHALRQRCAAAGRAAGGGCGSGRGAAARRRAGAGAAAPAAAHAPGRGFPTCPGGADAAGACAGVQGLCQGGNPASAQRQRRRAVHDRTLWRSTAAAWRQGLPASTVPR